MASSGSRRGDVLVARRRLGFGAEGVRELFVTIQSDDLNVLETVVVAPLDVGAPMYAGDPLVVAVPARETGATSAQVVLVHLLAAVPRERFERDVAGRLSVRSMQRIDETLLAVLAL